MFLGHSVDQHYLLGDLDEQEEHDEDEQVVKDADSSDDDVDDLERKVTDVGEIRREIIVRLRRGRRNVDPDITGRRRVVHRHRFSQFSVSVIVNCLGLYTDRLKPITYDIITTLHVIGSHMITSRPARSSRASTNCHSAVRRKLAVYAQ